MNMQVFRVHRAGDYRKAGPTDLIELLPAPGSNPLFIMKWILETLVYGIVNHEFIHLSGPTGGAKSSLLEALYLVPANFVSICYGLGFKEKPLVLYPIEMAIYEAPGELYQRRSLRDGSTYDELSKLVVALEKANEKKEEIYPLIWLREMGRVHSSSVQGGLLNLMTRNDVVLPDGRRLSGSGISWVADSNYQAEGDSTHTLVTLDDALKRRFTVNLTMDYLSAEQETQVLQYLTGELHMGPVDPELIARVVKLGHLIRRQRLEGALLSIAPPTIYGYLAFLRMAVALPHLSHQQIAMTTFMGNAGLEDRKAAFTLFNEVFGLQPVTDDGSALGGNLF